MRIDNPLSRHWANNTLVQLVKNLPAMQEAEVQSLSGKHLLEKKLAAHSIILAWKISWTEEPGGLQSMRSQRDRQDLAIKTYHQPPNIYWVISGARHCTRFWRHWSSQHKQKLCPFRMSILVGEYKVLGMSCLELSLFQCHKQRPWKLRMSKPLFLVIQLGRNQAGVWFWSEAPSL